MSEHLSTSELDALLEAARAASRGPWKVYKTPFTLTELGRTQGFKEDRKAVVNAIGQTWDHPQLKGPLPIVTTQHGPYYEPQHAVKIEDADAEYIALANPAIIERLVLMVRELENKLQFVTNERNRLLQSSLTTEATQAMQIDELQSDLAEEKRLRAELKQIAQIGIAEVSSVGTRLQECAVHDAIEHFRARAVRAIDALEIDVTHDHFYLNGYSRAKGDAKHRIKSLPLVETEEE